MNDLRRVFVRLSLRLLSTAVCVMLSLLPQEEQEWMECHLSALAFTLTHTISLVKTSPCSVLHCVQMGLDSLILKQLLPGGVDSRKWMNHFSDFTQSLKFGREVRNALV